MLALRQQLNALRRGAPKRRTFSICDRLIFVLLYRIAPGILDALAIVQPETILRWHRAGFRAFWRWKSRRRRGRPKVPSEIRRLIREMSLANPLWGAPLSLSLIRSEHNGDAIRRAPAGAESARSPEQLWELVHPCLRKGAFASHCNTRHTSGARDVNAVR